MIALLTLGFNACVGDDIDNLQKQIDDLDQKVEELEAAQEEALLAAIADMQAALAAMESSLDADYQRLLDDLTSLEDVVENNKSAIYYGNLITDADYDAFVAQGAEIVTGRVIIAKDDHATKVANLIMIGDDLQIEGGMSITLPVLETVAGDLKIQGMDDSQATIELTKLASVSGELYVNMNPELVSLSAPALVLVYENLMLMDNVMLADVSMPALDLVGELNIYGGYQFYNSFDLSATDVNGDANVYGLVGLPEFALGVVGGNISIGDFEEVSAISIANEVITGDLLFQGVNNISSILMPNLKKVEKVDWNGGNITIVGVYPPASGGGGIGIGITSANLKATASADVLGWTNNIEVVEGNIDVRGNNFTEVDAFNSVTSVGGYVSFESNGKLSSFYVMDAVTEVVGEITISEKSDVIDGFNSLVNHFGSAITIEGQQVLEVVNFEYVFSGVCEVNGFSALESAQQLVISLNQTTAFNAFAALTSLNTWAWPYSLTIYMQNPDLEGDNGPVGLCSMGSFLENAYSNDEITLMMYDHNGVEVADYNTALVALLYDNCGSGGIGIGM